MLSSCGLWPAVRMAGSTSGGSRKEALEDHQEVEITLDDECAAQLGGHGIGRALSDPIEQIPVHPHHRVGPAAAVGHGDVAVGNDDVPVLEP